MKQSDHNLNKVGFFSTWISGAIGTFLILALFLATPAWASYEQVGTFFDTSNEGEWLNQARGMAINIGGVGGVPAGSVHVVSRSQNAKGVARYDTKGEFLGAWGKESVGHSHGVAIDPTTGNVYVVTENKVGVVRVFNADGSQPIAAFGELGAFDETTDEGPEKIHRVHTYPNAIAVDSSGVVYLSDPNGSETRIMVFEPQSPGDYEHYVYAGRAHDIAVGYFPTNPVLDSAGDLYTVNEEAIYEFAPGEPDTPICDFQQPAGGIEAMTVNPESGAVFYYGSRDKRIHELSSCNTQGKFIEKDTFTVTPKKAVIPTLAFNPALSYEGSRPAGVLYAVDREKAADKPAQGHIFAPAEIHSPSVESESVSSVTSSTAILGAQIHPKGSKTRYVFQYITDAAYQENEPADRFADAAEAPLGGSVLGGGQEALSAGVSLVGLQPDTEYRYRAVATSHCNPEDEAELCEDVGDAQAFRTFPIEALGLPDDRAYELVSPAQKYGGEVIPADPLTASCGSECKPGVNGARFPMQSASDSDAVVYQGFSFSFTEGAVHFNEYLSRRADSGWTTTILSPSLMSGSYKAFDTTLTHGLLSQNGATLSPEAPAGYANLYTQPTAAPSALTPLVGFEPPNRFIGSGSSFELTYAGASADFSQLFFEANDALTGETPFAPEALDPGPGTALNHPKNLYEAANGELRLVNVLPGNTETVPGAAFGSGIQLSEGPTPTSNFSHAISDDGSRVFWSDEAGQVYVRENGESTRVIPDPGKFLTASADGSKVLLDSGHIYDLGTEETIDLTEGEGGFQGIVGQSEDLSRIYFVDTAVLTGEEENNQGAKAQTGKHNLYAWYEGAVAFVTTLDSKDNEIGVGFDFGDWRASPARRTAGVSPNGRWIAFLSQAPLTGYNSTGPCERISGTNKYLSSPCPEVFLYDSASGKLICPSCNPSGARPLGPSMLRLIRGAPGSLPQPRYLTNEGRLYFDTRDSLTPFDTNDGVEDVYQYEPEGVGSCKREGGCVNLISAGHEPVDSNLLAIDATGKNVFFTTRDQLVLKDRDDLIDLYVAREGGGIAAETETVTPGCQGEACQPAVVVPNDPTPASSSFEGAGNVVEKKVTKKAKANRKKRKQRAKKRRHKRAHGRAANHNRGGAR